MTRWTIGARIGGSHTVLLVLLAVMAGVSVFALATARDRFDEALTIQRDHAEQALLAAKRFSDVNRDFRAYLLTGDERLLDRHRSDLDAARSGFTTLAQTTTGAARARWARVVTLTARWETGAQRAIAARRDGRRAQAIAIFERSTLPPALEQDRLVRDGIAADRERAQDARSDARHRSSLSMWLVVIVALLALPAGIVLAIAVARSVTRTLRTAIGTVASAAAEILAATRQQASGALEEETAVQQTSTTVEEVKQTVQLSTEKAGGVADAVLRTSEVSDDGRRAVDAAIRGARDAKAQMQALADRILALSEQATVIGEITATVNDLADRSSLLAVNAGIEAAKAGEAGRGFAVVAAEVKALAEQSKQAAAEIRRNLGEIAEATQAAVMATEQGMTASESGETLAGEAGEAIHELAEKLEESAQSAQQILASSHQQMTGMEQVALAMENIRQTVTQNMAATRQVEQAAKDLNALAQSLRDLVSRSETGVPVGVG